MVCMIRRMKADGTLVAVGYEANTLGEAELHEPKGSVYTITNTYHRTRVLKLEQHLDRLENSANTANIPMQLERQKVRQALRKMIEDADVGDVRFRITVDPQTPDEFILSIEPFTPPSPQLIAEGVWCITAPNSARHEATVKSTDWMHKRKQLAQAMPTGIYDTFLLDAEGHIMEGLGANFYAIMDGTLYTAGEGVLKGIAQKIVLEVAPDILPVVMQAPTQTQISHFDEAFLTSSSRGIIPVVEIDGITIADGTPQPLTKQLRQAYLQWAEDNMQEL
jgi:branched-chain amino acid aminotransferase